MGEIGLLTAIVIRAIKDFLREKARNQVSHSEGYPANDFLFSKCKEEPELSFDKICHYIDVDPNEVRKWILKKSQKRKARKNVLV